MDKNNPVIADHSVSVDIDHLGISTSRSFTITHNGGTKRLFRVAENGGMQVWSSDETDKDINLVHVQVTGNPVLSWDESNDTFAFTDFVTITNAAKGFRVRTGSDEDLDLLHAVVNGSPKLDWDESEDQFRFNKGLIVDGDIECPADSVTTLALSVSGTAGIANLDISNSLDVNTTDGIDFVPGSDIDHDILSSNVSGNPKLFWDENEHAYSFSTDSSYHLGLHIVTQNTNYDPNLKYFQGSTARWLVGLRNVASPYLRIYDYTAASENEVMKCYEGTGGEVEFSRYVRFGTGNEGIRIKKVTGTFNATPGTLTIAHGLTASKIIQVWGHCYDSGSGYYVTPSMQLTNYNYRLYWDGTNVIFEPISASSLASDPVEALIVYEQ